MRISDWSSDVCSSDLAGEAGGVAVGAEALREAGTAPQAAERAEHLDLRSHGAAQVAPAARLPARQPGCAVPGDAARQPIPAARQRGSKARRLSPWGQGDRKSVVEGKSVSGRVDIGGRRIIKKKNTYIKQTQNNN